MQREGCSFLIVSHSPNLVANFCTRAIVLEGGKKLFDGPTIDALNRYKEIRVAAEGLAEIGDQARIRVLDPGTAPLSLVSLAMSEGGSAADGRTLIFTGRLRAARAVTTPVFHFGLRNNQGITISAFTTGDLDVPPPPLAAGEERAFAMTMRNHLGPGPYFASVWLAEQIGDDQEPLSVSQDVLRIDLLGKTIAQGIVDLDVRFSWGAAGAQRQAPQPLPERSPPAPEAPQAG
jgi:hypothetical protein